MKLKLKESYGNDHVTTQTGFVFKKDIPTLYEKDDFEVNHLLKQGTLEIVDEGIEVPKEDKKSEVKVEDKKPKAKVEDKKPKLEPISTDTTTSASLY